MVELTYEKFKNLQEAYAKLKTGITELQLCLDELKSEMCQVDYSGTYIKHDFTMQDLIKFGDSKYAVFKDSSRKSKNVFIRYTLIYLAKQHGFSYNGIGKYVGLKHCTCIHACNQVEDHLFIKNVDFVRVFNLVVQEFNEYLENKKK